jgi:hypothetical protein
VSSGLPFFAWEIADSVLTPAQLAASELPEFRRHRRTLIEAEGFRQALRDAGWRKSEIRRWLVTGEVPR